MAVERSLFCATDKRRGDNLPVRLRFAARRGLTLIELLIAMMVLAITCVSWLKIIGIQSARKEARRREAVERLAGMMDAFMYVKKTGTQEGSWRQVSLDPLVFDKTAKISEPIEDLSPIGYRICVVKNLKYLSAADNEALFEGHAGSFAGDWQTKKWLVGMLYNNDGATEKEAGKPFFVLPVCLGF